MTADEHIEIEYADIARKCGRIIHAYSAGCMCRSEMLYQLDQLVPPGHEDEVLAELSEETRSRLAKIYESKSLTRETYDGRYRVHLAICDSDLAFEG